MSFIYKGLKATLEQRQITPDEVKNHMQQLLRQNPKITSVTDRPTQNGDEVVLDYAGFCDGEQFAGGTAQNQTLTLGSGTFIPGFEEQLLGKNCGEEVVVNVTFPEQYHSDALAGKKAEFRCKLHAIRVKSSYEMDDTFAKEVGGCDTLAEMEQRLAESLQAHVDQQAEMELQDKLLRQAAETLEVEITEQELQRAMDEQLDNLKAQLSAQGLTLEMYCSFMGLSVEQLRQDAREGARINIRIRAAIDEVVRLESLEATKEEIGQALAAICRQNRMTMEQLKPFYDAEFEQAVIRSVLSGKAAKLIRDNAVIE